MDYINQTYNPTNDKTKRPGLDAGDLIKFRADFATDQDEQNFIADMAARGALHFYIEEEFIDLSTYQRNARSNKVMFQLTQNVPLNALSTSYVDVFPALYSGLPIPIDTTGYEKMGMVLLWNKNGGVGTHTIKFVKCNANGVITQPEQVLRETGTANGGYLADFNYRIPNEFINYTGFVKLQAKSSNGTDSPRFDGLWIYMIRR